jgi:membrane-associated protease RseP (regulator of RpoE activity)
LAEEELKQVEFQYGVVLLRTKRFQSLMDRLGARRISKPIGWILLYFMPVIAAVGLFIFLTQLSIFFSPVRSAVAVTVRGLTPLAYLGLPGINPYLPWVYGWVALVVAMVVHEGAHGIVARSLGLPVKSSGLVFFLVVPIGAFVEVDESAMKVARARDSGRVLAAGAGTNFVVAVVALLLLFAVVSSMTPQVKGLAVTQVVNEINGNPCTAGACPALSAGLMPGDFITAVNGIKYNDSGVLSQMESNGSLGPGKVVTLTVWRSGGYVPIPAITMAANPDNVSRGYLGVVLAGSDTLQSIATSYSNSFLTRPTLYLCIPTFPQCQDYVPFSGALASFYTSPYGSLLTPLATLLYWMFFLNFNLAVFNALPLYPLDGGQAFRVGVQALGRGKLSEKTLTRICAVVALLVLAAVFSFPVAAYLHLI